MRDLLLGFAQIDFDVAYEGDAAQLAATLVGELGGEYVVHERFGTANVRLADGVVVDIAAARAEHYPQPGALPVVRPATIAEDLARRDFSVNAMAMALWEPELGRIESFPDAASDLVARLLRVTHDASFLDDPTRLLRLARYGARLGFAAEPHTEDLARQAIAGGALATVSGARVADELLDLLGERSAVVGIDALAALGLDRAIHPRFNADEYLAARAMLRLDDGLRQDLLLLAICSRELAPAELDDFLAHLGLPARERVVVADATQHADAVASAAADATRPSQIADALRGHQAETAALAAALPDTPSEARTALHAWLDLRTKEHLLITGADLRTAGIPEGPAIGRALAATLNRALDGDLTLRDDQLAFALVAARAGSEHNE